MALSDVTNVRSASSFNSEMFMGVTFVIVTMKAGEVGFGLLDAEAPRWVETIRRLLTEPAKAAVDD